MEHIQARNGMTDSEVLTLAVRQTAAFAEPDLCPGLDDAYQVQIATARLRYCGARRRHGTCTARRR